MRRVKSAPKDLALMVNRKTNQCKKLSFKNIIPFTEKFNNNVDNNIDNKLKLSELKKTKYAVSTFNNVIGDVLNYLNINNDDNLIISLTVGFLSENLYNNNKTKLIYEFLIQALFRYLITFLIHKTILYQDIIIPEMNHIAIILHLTN